MNIHSFYLSRRSFFKMNEKAKELAELDLELRSHQARVISEDIKRTERNAKYVQFEYLFFTSIAVCNKSGKVQSLISKILYDCTDVFLMLYLDNILTFSKDETTYLDYLEICYRVSKRINDTYHLEDSM